LSSHAFCLSDTLKHVVVELPQRHGALEVFPLHWPVASHLDYATLDEALEARSVEITEFTEAAQVPRIKIVNRTNRMVFLMAGEHLVGGKQNRVLNASIMVPPHTEMPLPVTCVEHGRWGYSSSVFSSAHSSSHHKLRAMMSEQAVRSYRRAGVPSADQAAVWREVSRKMRAMCSRSSSDTLQAMFFDCDRKLTEWAHKFPAPTGCNGAVFVVAGVIAGADLFGSPDTLRKLWPKLVRSCAIDALESPKLDQGSTAPGEIASWLAGAAEAGQEAFPSPGLGLDVRIQGKEVTGASLVVEDQPIHTELFQPIKPPHERAGSEAPDAEHRKATANTCPRAANGRDRSLWPEPKSAGEARMLMQFHSFDGPYVQRLRSGDFRTQQHFVAYFSELIRLKLGKRLRSPSAIEDVRQETFTRVWVVLRNEDGLTQPERLGAFVNSVCNNVLREHYRRASKEVPSEDEVGADVPDPTIGAVDVIANGQVQRKVRQVLHKLSERDRLLLEHVFLEERDKDEVCRDFGVTRDYLRVLLHRARKSFRALLLKERKAHSGEPCCPAATPLAG
jgi:RNA polymerase sigma-70 factor (ECF subfamily)